VVVAHRLSTEGLFAPMSPIVGSFPVCCARARSGEATAALASNVMKSRRFN
jgi:hypothetical protein